MSGPALYSRCKRILLVCVLSRPSRSQPFSLQEDSPATSCTFGQATRLSHAHRALAGKMGQRACGGAASSPASRTWTCGADPEVRPTWICSLAAADVTVDEVNPTCRACQAPRV